MYLLDTLQGAKPRYKFKPVFKWSKILFTTNQCPSEWRPQESGTPSRGVGDPELLDKNVEHFDRETPSRSPEGKPAGIILRTYIPCEYTYTPVTHRLIYLFKLLINQLIPRPRDPGGGAPGPVLASLGHVLLINCMPARITRQAMMMLLIQRLLEHSSWAGLRSVKISVSWTPAPPAAPLSLVLAWSSLGSRGIQSVDTLRHQDSVEPCVLTLEICLEPLHSPSWLYRTCWPSNWWGFFKNKY